MGRAALPKVNYPTALDWFVILCFGTVFAVLVEYAVINFIDKVRVDIQRLLEERKKQKELREALKVRVVVGVVFLEVPLVDLAFRCIHPDSVYFSRVWIMFTSL